MGHQAVMVLNFQAQKWVVKNPNGRATESETQQEQYLDTRCWQQLSFLKKFTRDSAQCHERLSQPSSLKLQPDAFWTSRNKLRWIDACSYRLISWRHNQFRRDAWDFRLPMGRLIVVNAIFETIDWNYFRHWNILLLCDKENELLLLGHCSMIKNRCNAA